MRTTRARAIGATAGTAVLAVLATGLMAAVTAPQTATAASHEKPSKSPFTFAVIGDIPYGASQIAAFPRVVDQINADPAVRFVDHLGDIKSGSSVCSDDYFAMVRAQFDRFQDPLVYTPGDNEWTDCHRANNGSYDPLERLAAVRTTFFPVADRTLGQRSVEVESQVDQGFPENVRYDRAGVSFAALHVVGSDNALAPRTGQTAPTSAQQAEVAARTQAALDLIDETFAEAGEEHGKAVVLMMQADMFDPTVGTPSQADFGAFAPIVARIVARSAAFRGPVYLFNGDSHVYTADQPLAAGSSWLSFYGVSTPAPNLTRITVDGSTGVADYLRVQVEPRNPAVLTWEKVPFTG